MKKGIFYILLSAVLVSSTEIALKVISMDFNPLQLNFLRFIIASIVLVPPAVKGLKARHCRLKKADYAFFALTGFICVVVSMIFYQLAILYSPAAKVAVLYCCNPVFVVLFAFFLLHEKIYKHTIVSLIVSILGIVVLMNPFHMTGSILGFAFTMISTVTFALYSVVSRRKSSQYGGIVTSCFSFLFGSAEMLMLILISRIPFVSQAFTQHGLKIFASVPLLQGLDTHTLPTVILIGAVITGLGYTAYFLAMEETSTATGSVIFFIKPVLSPIFVLIFIREPITVSMAFGIALIFAGSLNSFISDFQLHKQEISLRSGKKNIQTAKSESKIETN